MASDAVRRAEVCYTSLSDELFFSNQTLDIRICAMALFSLCRLLS